jgi:DNA repair protein RadC
MNHNALKLRNLLYFSYMAYNDNLNIKSWAEEDRPREKFALKGKGSLSDAELIAILIGSGSRNESAVELSKKILNSVKNNLNELGKQTLDDLMKFKGIGEAKAIAISAALELGRRRKGAAELKKPKIQGSATAFEQFAPVLCDLQHEEFWILMLNRANEVIEVKKISSGGVAGTVADAKMIFQPALAKLCAGIILGHNHPSGNLRPSMADKQLTEKLVKAGKTLDINVLDHLIIGGNKYYSFADEGLI